MLGDLHRLAGLDKSEVLRGVLTQLSDTYSLHVPIAALFVLHHPFHRVAARLVGRWDHVVGCSLA